MASGQWWVIAYSPAGGSTTYQYYQGTKAQAQAQANLAVKIGGSNLSGPYATEADAQAAVKSGKVNQGRQSQAQQAVTAAGNAVNSAVQNVLGLPTFSNTRNLVIRSAKVIVGMLLVAIGAVKLFHVEQAIKDVAPIVGKAALV
jgi:hypothetical protein